MSTRKFSDKAFIRKLTDAIENNLDREDFGVAELAREVEMSQSHIHRKLKSITNQSASQFIRELRLEKARVFLQQDAYTVSEVAFMVGFRSPSYFSTCFHEYFGTPPGEFYRKENTEMLEDKQKSHVEKSSSNSLRFQKSSHLHKYIVLLGLALIVTMSFVFYSYFTGNVLTKSTSSNTTKKSIAVLPLKNLSNDIENQYLADGIMEDILSRLSKIHDLEVKSRISSEQYREPNLSIPEIAKEMNVSYILEGSLMKVGENIRLYVQLIEAKHDLHLWTTQYDSDLSDILTFVTNASEHVAYELEAVISPEEKKLIDKLYTRNEEAYGLYLEGRFYWKLAKLKNWEKSIEYYNQAIKIDSAYSLAYAGLSDSYYSLGYTNKYQEKEMMPLSKSFALKALVLDNTLAESHAALGRIAMCFDFDWKLAERELQKAIEINPNYAEAHHWYAAYLEIMNRKIEARNHLDRAIELSPLSTAILWHNYGNFLNNQRFERALMESEKLFRIDANVNAYTTRNFNIYIRQKKDKEAIEMYKQKHACINPDTKFSIFVDSIYSADGINGVIQNLIEFMQNRRLRYEFLARLHAIKGDKHGALDYLEKAYENNQEIVFIKYSSDYKDLRSEPRFIALLKKMNLDGY